MEKYEEVLHHLQFAQELHKTLDGLTMNVSLSVFSKEIQVVGREWKCSAVPGGGAASLCAEVLQLWLSFLRETRFFPCSLKVPFILLLQLLRAQKKLVKKDQLAKVELERRQVSLVLQVQHLLQGLRQEHVRRDLLAGNNQAPQLSAEKLRNLNQLATLLGAERDPRLR